jgi:ABC-type Na+ efflux pump permease subunit
MGSSVIAIARADFLDRVRRYSFLVTFLFSIFLGYGAGTGVIAMRVSNSRGLYTSAWIGTSVALVAGCFISLAGFYVVKNSVERDRLTGVGQILAASPLSKITYASGKWLSNTAVLMAQLGVLAVGAVLMFWIVGETPHLNPWQLLSPFLLLAAPMMALTGAFAVAFEMAPGLKGGFGNVVWFFLYTTLVSLPVITRSRQIDPMGLLTVMNSLKPAAQRAISTYTESFSLSINDAHLDVVRGLRWDGVSWDATSVAIRLGWIVASFGLVCLAASVFDRFDRSPAPAKYTKVKATVIATPVPSRAESHWTPWAAKCYRFSFLSMVVAELRLALKGYRWWWYLVAMVLVLGQLAAPISIARGPLLAIAWIWPVLIWSAMGVREARNGTLQLIASSAHSLWRQLPSCWLAGVIVTALCGLGAGVRLTIAMDYPELAALAAASLLIPSLSLALGVWTRSSRAFEAAFTVLWYVGPMSHTPGVDFTGSANGNDTLRFAFVYLTLAVFLFGAAIPGRKRMLIGW